TFQILLVEDEAVIRELVKTMLSSTGIFVSTVEDGHSAIRMARVDPPPDLILLDIVIPQLDGISVCRILKSEPSTAGIPIYRLTARIREADKEAAGAAGADGYLEKPFRAAELFALVERVRADPQG